MAYGKIKTYVPKPGQPMPTPAPGGAKGDGKFYIQPVKPPRPKRKTIGGGSVSKNITLKSKPLTLRQAALRNTVKRGR